MSTAGKPPPVIWNTRQWAEATVALETGAGLKTRTVLVPRERVAHALRRELVRMKRPDVLAGSRFVDLVTAAEGVMEAAGVEFSRGEGALRPARLRELFRHPPKLGYFRAEQLADSPGWAEAFARSIGELEAAGATPETLKKGASPQSDDVAAVWNQLELSAGTSWTSARVLREAAERLEKKPELWPFEGLVLAALSGDETPAAARLLRALPRCTLALLAARPARRHLVERLEVLFGPEVSLAAAEAQPLAGGSTELALLQRYLLEKPSVQAELGRPVSAGPDGTVQLEEHAGVEGELEATADWVAREVLERQTPLEEIAVLVPSLHPLAGLVVDRLQRLGVPNPPMPVFVAGGLPVTGTATGTRLLAVLRALQSHLSAASLAELLPSLKTAGKHTHLSRGSSMELLYALGTLGGTPAEPAAGLQWAARLDERPKEIQPHLDRLIASDAAGDEDGDPHELRNLRWVLETMAAVRPPLLALVEVLRRVQTGAGLDVLWTALHGFLDTWLLMPGDGVRHLAQLNESVLAVASESRSPKLTGQGALEFIEGALRSLKVATGRFGEPAVYVGTVRDAVGLPFRAVRIIGLAEGALPSLAREDPVLSTELKGQLLGPGFFTPADRMLSQLQSVHRVVCNSSARVVLSTARTDLEGTAKEPSSLFIEAAVALRRPEAASGKPGAVVPNLAALQRDFVSPARRDAARFRRDAPLTEAAWQEVAARTRGRVPPGWLGVAELDLKRMSALATEEGGPMDGILGSDGVGAAMRGLDPELPISASRLKTLLECPQKFFYENVMGWGGPAGPPSQREIDPMPFGSLMHRTAELFFRTHGADFGARRGTLDDWLEKGLAVAEAQFAEFLQHSALLGAPVREQQLDRLRRHVTSFLEYDWNEGVARTYTAVERGFGYDAPLALEVGGELLHVHGYIDRLDVEGGKTLVRDLKTGRAHPRGREDVDPRLDVQLALYGMVVAQLAKQWKVPKKVAAAYVYTLDDEKERAFRDDFPALEEAAGGWLEVGVALLKHREFPRTPVADDCRYCGFSAVCGGDAPDRSARLLAEADDGPAQAFGALRMEDTE